MKRNSPAKYLVEPVKLFAALLYRESGPLEQAREALREAYGEEDFISEPSPFDHTDFYKPEMGAPLFRLFVSYRRLVPPSALIAAKLEAERIENTLCREDGGRQVNIDPGILDYQKVVLASYKYQGQKIYLGQRVWADLTLYYRKGGWSKFEWTFPDFKTGMYDKILLEVRRLYKLQRLEDSSAVEPA